MRGKAPIAAMSRQLLSLASRFDFQTAKLEAVILRHRVSPLASPMIGSSGVSSTPQLLGSIVDVSEYWIARWSLSSGAHSRDPVAGDDGRRYGLSIHQTRLRIPAAQMRPSCA
jgi:hypothetical protein